MRPRRDAAEYSRAAARMESERIGFNEAAA